MLNKIFSGLLIVISIGFFSLAFSLSPKQHSVANNPCMVGEVVMTALAKHQYNKAPKLPEGWEFCNGQTLDPTVYPELHALIGTKFNGNFPDFRNRVAIGAGNGPDLTPRPLGQYGGNNNPSFPVSSNGILSHNHTGTIELPALQFDPKNIKFTTGNKTVLTVGNKSTHSIEVTTVKTSENTNSSPRPPSSFSNMQAYTIVKYIICTGN